MRTLDEERRIKEINRHEVGEIKKELKTQAKIMALPVADRTRTFFAERLAKGK